MRPKHKQRPGGRFQKLRTKDIDREKKCPLVWDTPPGNYKDATGQLHDSCLNALEKYRKFFLSRHKRFVVVWYCYGNKIATGHENHRA